MSKNQPTLPRSPLITSKDDWNGIYLRHDRQPAFELPEHTHTSHTLIVGMDNALRCRMVDWWAI